jgi:hypothetical protein
VIVVHTAIMLRVTEANSIRGSGNWGSVLFLPLTGVFYKCPRQYVARLFEIPSSMIMGKVSRQCASKDASAQLGTRQPIDAFFFRYNDFTFDLEAPSGLEFQRLHGEQG